MSDKVIKAILTIVAIICVLAISFSIICSVTPFGKALINKWKGALQKTDDETNYETLKKVEDTCRAMIATYNRDKAEYENNRKIYLSSIEKANETDHEATRNIYIKEAENALKMSESYRQQANNTASTYNDYILKNSYVWKNDVPADIYMKLDMILVVD